MPAFQPLQPGKRKQDPASDESDTNRKRHITEVAASNDNAGNSGEHELYWMVQWRKPQYKKHKTWDGDGVLVVKGSKAELYDLSGKIISSSKASMKLSQENVFFVGDKEVEFDRCLAREEYLSRSCFNHDGAVEQHSLLPDKKMMNWHKPYISLTRAVMPDAPAIIPETEGIELQRPVEAVSVPISTSSADLTSARDRLVARQNGFGPCQRREVKPLHDPNKPGAVVMKMPVNYHSPIGSELPVVPVVLDPILANKMRPHQLEGVKFMYESVMGFRKHEGQGCILADEMGLGKSLQTIALIWTLLKQNSYAGLGPAAKKVLLVCPVTLINNWKAEFNKWLGRDRINVAVCDGDTNAAQTFANAKAQQVLIIGYERLRTATKYISFSVPPIDLIVCDEGHKLKSSSNKTREVFSAFRTPRKVLLSGTPVQNDLREFHAMVDFCNPGLLGDYPTFHRIYEIPILRGRAPDASTNEVEEGNRRSVQLHAVARSFILRRDMNVLQGRLPPKHEYVVFVAPTSLQLTLYMSILQSKKVDDLVQSSQIESLALIGMLAKISNSPVLLKATVDNSRGKIQNLSKGLDADGLHQILALLPQGADIADVSLSGKLTALSKLLHVLYQSTDEKCVIVSHYTSTLNILEVYCKKNNYQLLRLDGQTPASKRQEIVDKFNKSSQKSCFIFLLSSKAGGVGINLTGASRLCLIDCDWNPSHDIQAMARCHRDGQTRPVFVYRLLTTGFIDEKIYQRQVTKLGLAGSLIGDNVASKGDSFSRNELRDIFRVDPATTCNTHDLLQCPCGGLGVPSSEPHTEDDQPPNIRHHSMGFVVASQVETEPKTNRDLALTTLHEWKHFDCSRSEIEVVLEDEILSNLLDSQKQQRKQIAGELGGGDITFVFEKNT